MSSSARNWCLTINNYTDDDIACFKQDPEMFKYWGYAPEVGENGTPHLQAFVCTVRKMRMSGVKRLFPRAHVEMMKGTVADSEAYCSKSSALTVYGTPPMSAAATEKLRWAEALASMKSGDLDSLPPDIFIRYYRTARAICKDYMTRPEALSSTCGTWLSGRPGAGKSHVVINTFPNRYIKSINKWWDGYQGEAVVHLDEVDPSHTSWIGPFLKKWADKWPFDAEVKGGAMQIRPKRIIVTSNYTIEEMGFDKVTTEAISRRFESIVKVKDQNIQL